jgi:hypothetical protein
VRMYRRHRWPDRTYLQPSRQKEGYNIPLSVREMLGNCRRRRVLCRPLQTPASSGFTINNNYNSYTQISTRGIRIKDDRTRASRLQLQGERDMR